MEQYLKDDYNVIEDTNYLKSESDIKDYFRGLGMEEIDCGQGYYEDSRTWIAKVADEFYEVTAYAEIDSAKQDRGDRLYWVDRISKVEWEKIDKPLPKQRKVS